MFSMVNEDGIPQSSPESTHNAAAVDATVAQGSIPPAS